MAISRQRFLGCPYIYLFARVYAGVCAMGLHNSDDISSLFTVRVSPFNQKLAFTDSCFQHIGFLLDISWPIYPSYLPYTISVKRDDDLAQRLYLQKVTSVPHTSGATEDQTEFDSTFSSHVVASICYPPGTHRPHDFCLDVSWTSSPLVWNHGRSHYGRYRQL